MLRPDSLSYYIVSLGCSKNLVDSEKLNGGMLAAGFLRASEPSGADIIIINTCGFIEDAKKESVDVILDAACLEGEGPASPAFPRRLAVAGCLAGRYPSELGRGIPEIDFLYGLLDDDFIPAMCRAFGIAPARPRGKRAPLDEGAPFAYIKISEGCSNNCSYCAIPLIRGPHRSFSPRQVLDDAREAVARGALELNIIAQDIASYRSGKTGLAGLVKKISSIEGVRWIRLLYCHPDHVDDGIIALIRDDCRVRKYIDIPFQHAAPRILKSMGRKGGPEQYLALIEKLRKSVPGIHIRSTVMVGYPGETEEEFRLLVDFLKSARLERLGCFIYSGEEGTRAFQLGDTVPAKTKRARHRRIMTLQRRISLAKMREMVGRKVEVLVEEHQGGDRWIGRSEFDAPEVDGIFFLTSKKASLNTIVRAEVTDAVEYDLVGMS